MIYQTHDWSLTLKCDCFLPQIKKNRKKNKRLKSRKCTHQCFEKLMKCVLLKYPTKSMLHFCLANH